MAVKRIGGSFNPWTKLKTVEGVIGSTIYAARKDGQVTLTCNGMQSTGWVAEANVVANLPAWAMPMGGVDAPDDIVFTAVTKGSYDALGALVSNALPVRGTVDVKTGILHLHLSSDDLPLIGDVEIVFTVTYPAR